MAVQRRKKAGAAALALAMMLCTATACGQAGPSSQETSESQPAQVQVEPESTEPGEVTDGEIIAYFETFQQAAAAGEREKVAEMFLYPKQLQLPGQELTYVNSAEEFLPYYDQVFTAEFLEQIAQMEPDAFVREGSTIGWGDGAVWARTYDGQLAMASVFASREDRYLAYYEGNDNELEAEGQTSPASPEQPE